jgi:RNA polymerase sigma-70 factor (ECF subfamily)
VTASDKHESSAADKSLTVDFDTVYREHAGRVLGAIRAVLGPTDEIEDVVQNAFIEIYRCLHRFEGRSKLSTWVYRISVNVALQHIRKKKRRRWMVLGLTGDEFGRAGSRYNQVNRLEDRQVLSAVFGAVAKLSEKKRVVWTLHELEGLSPQEISEILGIPFNTVRSRLLASRRELMALLDNSPMLDNSPKKADEGEK